MYITPPPPPPPPVSQRIRFLLSGLLFLSVLLISPPAAVSSSHLPNPPVCDRTPQVRDAIVSSINEVSACGDVTTTHLASLWYLDAVYGTGLSTLQAGDFAGLSNLQSLDLKDNDLTILPATLFAGLSNLQSLDLSYNDLTTLSATLFTGLSNLQSLNLRGNDLTARPTIPVGLRELLLKDNAYDLSTRLTVNTLTDKAEGPFAAFDPTTDACGTNITATSTPATLSLREALIWANLTPGPDTITFDRSLAGQTLTLSFDGPDIDTTADILPHLCGNEFFLDGDLDDDETPDIILDGRNLPADGNGLVLSAPADIDITGLTLRNMPAAGILLVGSSDSLLSIRRFSQIEDNRIINNTGGGIVLVAGTCGALQQRTYSVIVGNTLAGNGTATTTPGILAIGGSNFGCVGALATTTPATFNFLNVNIIDNMSTDPLAISLVGGLLGGTFNHVTATLTGNTILQGPGSSYGITVSGGIARSGTATGPANQNEVAATLNDNFVSGAGRSGLVFLGGSSGMATSSTVIIRGHNNIVTGSGGADVIGQGGGTGDADFPATTGTGNTLAGSLTAMTADTITIENGIPGNTATLSVERHTTATLPPTLPTGQVMGTTSPATVNKVEETYFRAPASLAPALRPTATLALAAATSTTDRLDFGSTPILVDLVPQTVDDRPVHGRLSAPVRVCLPIPSSLTNAANVRLVRFDGTAWAVLPSTASAGQVCAEVAEFSFFGVASLQPDPTSPARPADPTAGTGGGTGGTTQPGTPVTPGTPVSGHISQPGQINFYEVTLERAGLLLVRTTGETDVTGTLSGPGLAAVTDDNSGAGANFRLAVPAAAGTYRLAVAGQGNQTGAYVLSVDVLRLGYLENPTPGSSQSGISIISGWVCEAERVEVELDGEHRLVAASGTGRADVSQAGECDGRADVGFGLLFNWNLLGDGEHTVRALADGVEFARATFTVTTLGDEFVRGASGATPLVDFPTAGEEPLRLVWQEASQSFMLAPADPAAAPAPAADLPPPPAPEERPTGVLENPAPRSFQSGISVISGWVCEAGRVEVELDGEHRLVAASGTSRADVPRAGECDGRADVGFGLLFNWNLLGDGAHTVRVLADGVEFARAMFTVTTLGDEFVRGASGQTVVADFPSPGEEVRLEWQEASQNFMITGVRASEE